MRLLSCELKQFGAFAKLCTWNIQTGVTGIVGSYSGNAFRSNGSGKTTLIMAIIYALYGKGFFKKIDEVVNDQANPVDSYVRLVFLKDNRTYEIHRGRTTSSYLSVKEDGVVFGDSATTIAVKQQEIERIIGMSYDMFTATIFFEQRAADKFINTDSSEATAYLDQILGLTDARTALANVRSRQNKDLQDLTEFRNKLSDLQKNIDSKPQVQKQIQDLVAAATALADEESMIVNELDEVGKQLAVLDSAIDLKRRSLDAQAEVVTLEQSLSVQQELLAGLQTSEREYEADLIKLDEAISQSQKDEIATADLIKAAKENSDAAKQDLDAENEKLVALKAEVMTISRQIKDQQLWLKNAQNLEVGECPTCRGQISADTFTREKEKAQEVVDGLQLKIHALIKHQREMEDVISGLTTAYNATLTENSLLLARAQKIKSDQAVHEPRRSQLQSQLTKVRDQQVQGLAAVTDFEKRLKAAVTAQEQAKLEADKAQALSVNGGELRQTQVNLKQKLQESKRDIESTLMQRGAATQLLSNIEASEQAYVVTAAQARELEEVVNLQERELFLLKSVIDKVFEDSIKLIEYYANMFLKKGYPEYTIKIYRDRTKKREPLVFDFECEGRKRPYHVLSGGEKTFADISIRLGFSRALMDRAKTSIEFICLDEPFESLDEYNREIIKKILIGLGDVFNQIIIISHTQDVHDCEHIVQLRKTSSGSELV
jgi:DNA repair exonuclease SbcCD ATPase subunit